MGIVKACSSVDQLAALMVGTLVVSKGVVRAVLSAALRVVLLAAMSAVARVGWWVACSVAPLVE